MTDWEDILLLHDQWIRFEQSGTSLRILKSWSFVGLMLFGGFRVPGAGAICGKLAGPYASPAAPTGERGCAIAALLSVGLMIRSKHDGIHVKGVTLIADQQLLSR